RLTIDCGGVKVRCVKFTPDGRGIVTGQDNGVATMWEGATGRRLFEMRGHTAVISAVAVSPDGRSIATGSWDNDRTVRVWDAGTGEEKLQVRYHAWAVGSVAFSPDGSRIVSGAADGTACVFSTGTGRLVRTIHTLANVGNAIFSPDGRRIIIGG